jgi:hypothetical protein
MDLTEHDDMVGALFAPGTVNPPIKMAGFARRTFE